MPDPDNKTGDCLTCKAVSKQKIHTLPCLRYKITECVLYRTGKAPGLEFTFRWPKMQLKDISNWANPEIRTIQLKSDICPIPFTVNVRRFVPIPQDSLHKGWMDGKTKKFKEVTPFAIVNMGATVRDLCEYINSHVFKCMEYFLKGRDVLVQETYIFARRYMMVAVSHSMPNILFSADLLSRTMKEPFSVTSSDCGLLFVAQPQQRRLSVKTPLTWSLRLKTHHILCLARSPFRLFLFSN